MKVTDYFARANGDTLISFEILPPLKGGSIDSIFNILDPLMEFRPPFVDVTYHREDFVYRNNHAGQPEKISMRKRPGTVVISQAIQNRYGVDTVPHLLCGGFTKEETEDALIDMAYAKINNVLALRGDARKFEENFVSEPGGHHYAIDLIRQIKEMNNGNYLDKDIVEGAKSNFCIGIAGYPEKHFEAPTLETDIQYLKEKINAGGEYIVTQMFFDNQKYFEFVALCRANDIQVPIVPGLEPLTRKSQLTSLPASFFIHLPEDLVKAITKAKSSEAVKQVGIEWGIAQCKELKAAKVPSLHFYTMGDSDTTRKIAESVF
ncbi:MAG: methylenetetrahydrofolate reductase [NAD(P)H] [Saprospiraceae bacterium]|nr:methylenetetrahydrofolate reductase [NAD(P)H] [Saprospiraceae bacterium]